MKKKKSNISTSLLSVSFSKGFVSPNLPIATFTQGDKELNFILDTGSSDNVIDKNTLKDIQYEAVKHNGTLAGVGGIHNVEACNVSFQYEGEPFTAVFLISDQLQEAFDGIRKAHAIQLHGMLGSQFLIENRLVMDFNNMVAYNPK